MDFFEKKAVNKCTSCRVKQSEVQVKVDQSLYKQIYGTGEVLVLVDMVEYPTMYEKLVRYLQVKGIENFQIRSTCLCRTKNFELPSPAYSVYNYCNCVDLNKIEYKTILCVGRALSFLTQGDDFVYWGDFSEYLFNDTYFIHKNKRVYPIPSLNEWVEKDSIQNRFVLKQVEFIKKHLINYSPFIVDPYEIIKVDEPNDFYSQYVNEECEIAWDTETSGLNHFDKDFRVGCITLTFDGVKGYYLPFEKTNKRLLSSFFKNKYQITANGKYDVKAMEVNRVTNSKVDEDIVLLGHLLNTERKKSGLKTLSWFIGMGGYDDQLKKLMKSGRYKTYLDIPENTLLNYAVLDAIATYRIYKKQMNELVPRQQSVYDTYKKYIIPVIPVFTKAEIRGMNIDVPYMNNLNSEIEIEIKELETEIKTGLGTNFDLNSPKQLSKVLIDNKFPMVDKTPTGQWQTGDKQLKEWSKKGFEVADLLLRYRSLSKMKSSFVGSKIDTSDNSFFEVDKSVNEGLAKFVRDEKIHATFNPARTNSWRGTGTDPNLQQITKHGEAGKRVRPIFACPEDYYICEADYSGFQLRIAGILSKDKVMEDLFLNKSGDMHSVTAQGVFNRGVTLDYFLEHKHEAPYDDQRYKAKGVNFGFIFGRGAYSFKQDIDENWTPEDIKKYIEENDLEIIKDDSCLTISTDIREKFFVTYPELPDWMEGCIQESRDQGYTDCILGGRRHLPLMKFSRVTEDSNSKLISHMENIAINSRVQCIHSDSIIYTNKGTFKIGDLYKDTLQNDNKCVVYNGENYNKAKVIYSGKFPTYRYTFSNGSSIISTNKHLYKVVNSDLTYSFKEAKDLTDKDYIQKCVPDVINDYQTFNVKSTYKNIQNENKYYYNKDIIVNEDLAWILGVMIGDGVFNDKESGSCFSEYDYDNAILFRDKLSHLLDTEINIRSNINNKKEQECIMYSVYTHLRFFNDILHKCGCYFEKSRGKRIPEIIWRSPKSVMQAFINGMFTTDGGIDMNSFNYSTVSQELAYDLCNLLNIVDIHCSLFKTGGDKAYRILIKRDYLLFLDTIGFTGSRREKQIEKFINKTPKRKSHNQEIPNWLSKEIAQSFENKEKNQSLSVIKSRVIQGKQSLSRYTALRMKSESNSYKFVEKNEFVTLKKVEYYGEQDTYDICMKEGSPEFITNTVAVHNTFEALTVYKAMIDIDKAIVYNNLKSIIVGTVHDSIVIYIHKDEVDKMYYIVKEAMEDKENFSIPLLADFSIGEVWGFGDEIEEKDLQKFKKECI